MLIHKHNVLKYNITSELVPFYHFTEMTEFEILNRYECLIKRNSEPCEHYCNQLWKYETNTKWKDIWNCYERLKIPKKLYGR